MNALVLAVAVAGLLGVVTGVVVARLAATFPWREADAEQRRPVPTVPVAVGTGVLFGLTATRIGLAWELPAFLTLAGTTVLLTVIDLQHRLLPNRVLLPSSVAGLVLLLGAAAPSGSWPDLGRALLAAVALFAGYLVMALISPRSLGMGDVKLAGYLGLHLGWIGWAEVVVGAAAGFVVQALLGIVLLATRRIGLRGELPFGPAMVLGAALAIAGGGAFLS